MRMNYSVEDFYNEYEDDIKDIILNNCDYCAEPHQLNEDDLIDNTNFNNIVDEIEINFDLEILDCEREEMIEFLKSALYELYEEDPTTFFI